MHSKTEKNRQARWQKIQNRPLRELVTPTGSGMSPEGFDIWVQSAEETPLKDLGLTTALMLAQGLANDLSVTRADHRKPDVNTGVIATLIWALSKEEAKETPDREDIEHLGGVIKNLNEFRLRLPEDSMLRRQWDHLLEDLGNTFGAWANRDPDASSKDALKARIGKATVRRGGEGVFTIEMRADGSSLEALGQKAADLATYLKNQGATETKASGIRVMVTPQEDSPMAALLADLSTKMANRRR